MTIISTCSLKPYTYIYAVLNDDTGDELHFFSTVPSPVNKRVEFFRSKFLVDRAGY